MDWLLTITYRGGDQERPRYYGWTPDQIDLEASERDDPRCGVVSVTVDRLEP